MSVTSEKFRKRSWWKILLAMVLAAAAGYAFIVRPWEPKPLEVGVEAVAEGPFQQVLAVNGRVVARDAVMVRAAVSAQALDVPVVEGDLVEAGDVLAELDKAQPIALVAQARAALDAGILSRTQAQVNSDRAIALGENATRSTR